MITDEQLAKIARCGCASRSERKDMARELLALRQERQQAIERIEQAAGTPKGTIRPTVPLQRESTDNLLGMVTSRILRFD